MPPMITGLSSDLLPHRQWAISKWFYSSSCPSPLWYYHRPGTDEEILPDRRFYRLVDPLLREVCHLLNDAGLHTTPSCQGHFYGRERFEHTWDELQREERIIRDHGLAVRDSETGSEYLFASPAYAVPWENFARFYEQASEHQPTGYLGIVAPESEIESGRRLAQGYATGSTAMVEDPDLGQMLGGRMFHVLVRCRTLEQRTREWAGFTAWVREMLGQRARTNQPQARRVA
jgi:hypothetical protein